MCDESRSICMCSERELRRSHGRRAATLYVLSLAESTHFSSSKYIIIIIAITFAAGLCVCVRPLRCFALNARRSGEIETSDAFIFHHQLFCSGVGSAGFYTCITGTRRNVVLITHVNFHLFPARNISLADRNVGNFWKL